MKRNFICLSILFIASIFVISCNNSLKLNPDNEYSTVSINLGSRNARAIGTNGLPELTEENTVIIVTDEKDKELAKGSTALNLTLKVGTKIKVKVSVTSAGASWGGEVTHTVVDDEDKNKISIKLSSLVKGLTALFYSEKSGDVFLNIPGSLKTVKVNPHRSLFTRDGKGRLYVLGHDEAEPLVRYNVDGTKDEDFSGIIKALSPQVREEFKACGFVVADAKNNTVYLYKPYGSDSKLYRISNAAELSSIKVKLCGGEMNRMFIYNDTIFATGFASENNFLAYTIKNEENSFMVSEKSATRITVEANISDIYADESGVYLCIIDIKEPKSEMTGGSWASVGRSRGEIQKYSYDYAKAKFKFEKSYGMSNSSLKTPFEIQPESTVDKLFVTNPDPGKYFYGAQQILGKDADGNLIIADNGFELGVRNEKARIIANKNRIAKLNPKTADLSFEEAKDSAGQPVNWGKDWTVWKAPNTDILVWNKSEQYNSGHFTYWLSKTGDEAYNSTSALAFDYTAGAGLYDVPKDIFCYDQDANLYIFFKNSNGIPFVKRFNLQADGSYMVDKSYPLYSEAGGSNIQAGYTFYAIAVDSSNPRYERLYFAYRNANASGASPIEVNYMYLTPEKAGDGTEINKSYNCAEYDFNSYEVLSLAANKDGLFVALKDKTAGTPNNYRLKIKKYKRDKTLDGELDLAPGRQQALNDMQIKGDSLYVLYSFEQAKQGNSVYCRGKIKKITGISGSITGKEVKDIWSGEENLANPATLDDKLGYAPYRFIANRPNELIIASDGFYAYNQSGGSGTAQYIGRNKNKVLIFDLQGGVKNKIDLENDKVPFSRNLKIDATAGSYTWK